MTLPFPSPKKFCKLLLHKSLSSICCQSNQSGTKKEHGSGLGDRIRNRHVQAKIESVVFGKTKRNRCRKFSRTLPGRNECGENGAASFLLLS